MPGMGSAFDSLANSTGFAAESLDRAAGSVNNVSQALGAGSQAAGSYTFEITRAHQAINDILSKMGRSFRLRDRQGEHFGPASTPTSSTIGGPSNFVSETGGQFGSAGRSVNDDPFAGGALLNAFGQPIGGAANLTDRHAGQRVTNTRVSQPVTPSGPAPGVTELSAAVGSMSESIARLASAVERVGAGDAGLALRRDGLI